MKKIELDRTGIFEESGIKKFLVHDSAYFKIINFNIKAGQTFPVHSHKIEGQLSILVLSGTGRVSGPGQCGHARQTRRHPHLRHQRAPRGPGHHRHADSRHHCPAHLIHGLFNQLPELV